MKKLNTILLPFVLLALTACGTLAPGGAYKDQVLYDADMTITTAYDVMHTFVKWEYDNRSALAVLPEVTKAADNIRAHARDWLKSAIVMRDIYKDNPTGNNKDDLVAALAILRGAMTEATRYLVQTKTGN